MARPVISHEPAHPVHVRLYRARAVPAHLHRSAHLVEEPGLVGHGSTLWGRDLAGRAKKRGTQWLPDAAAAPTAACGFSLSHASQASNRKGRPRKFSISVAAGADPPGARMVSR